jgi:hypothetical protein
LHDFDVVQTRGGIVPVASIAGLLKREKVDSIHVATAGVFGRDYLSSATLWKIDAAGMKTTIATIAAPANIWNGPSLHPVNVELSEGDFLQWSCIYESTENPPLDPLTSFGDFIEAGPHVGQVGCDIGFIFTNSRCGGVRFSPTSILPPDCADPLFSEEQEAEDEQTTLLVYNYLGQNGACSDGSQWDAHPYACTDQYLGGECAYCVGRANNIESKTCFARQGLDCNTIFELPERISMCNMEFECPASTFTFSFALILAFVAFLFN